MSMQFGGERQEMAANIAHPAQHAASRMPPISGNEQRTPVGVIAIGSIKAQFNASLHGVV